MINETIVLEVTGVTKRTVYPKGYSSSSEEYTFLELSHDTDIRKAKIVIPGNLPIGTRFTLTISQAEEVTSATIHRGALPNIDESKMLRGRKDEVQ